MGENSVKVQTAIKVVKPFMHPTKLHGGVDKNKLKAAIEKSKESIVTQSLQIKNMAQHCEQSLEQALCLIAASTGRIIISGMGKSGHIGRKIAATMASTGTPSFFVHPAEAFHGDLGMIQPSDVVVLISNTGETDEILKLIPSLQNFGNKIIAITGNTRSSLSKNSDVILNVKVDREICPNNLAPTSSTTATLVMGDALAIGLIHLRDFKPHHFALYHPGGSLGKRLLTQVKDVMHITDLPIVTMNQSMHDVILAMTSSTLGLAIVENNGALQGIITDGDLRRSLVQYLDFKTLTAQDIMTIIPITISQEQRLIEAEQMMRDNHIKSVIVVDEVNRHKVVGVLEYFQ
ncbi:KpsF/GutQ family sugar-phosphate isomerase [uncultured Paraglaciecola sp.]|uniref:KpsF/GutQ family sugar-phosphate isomerase n=1 Tax=uncultured Paraglaciecola sp. TaxID=1765024 RepID=UPI0030DCA67C